jgi:Flp pilus assembly protein TadD/predicted aspartyl protease
MRSAFHTGILIAAAAAWVAGVETQSTQPDVQIQLGDLLFAEGRYADAGEAYRRALGSDTAGSRAGVGLVLSALRLGNFDAAYKDASALRERYPAAADVAAIHGEALWAYGLFEDAEAAYDAALAADNSQPRGHHGRARSLAARSRLDEALAEAQEALRLNPREGEFYYTAGAIHVRRHSFEEAALAFRNYVNLLPNRDVSEKAAWARAQIRFLESFRSKRPLDVEGNTDGRAWRVPIRIERDKVLVRGKVNGGPPQDFILDTGAEQTVISRDVARRRGVIPVTYIQSAGVGDVGMRGLQVGTLDTFEIGDLRIRQVPCLIKNPPLTGLPSREPESFSPLALGLSMRVDYARRELTMTRRLGQDRYEAELPLRMHRLAMVGGRVNQTHRAPFVVDTGGEVISISQSTAGIIQPEPAFRRIPLKVYGTSGWDKDAFLMPNVDLEFNTIRFSRIPVVVLNLQAPSALLGFQLGGIVGHKFLSQYRLSIDLDRSIVGLDRNTGAVR